MRDQNTEVGEELGTLLKTLREVLARSEVLFQELRAHCRGRVGELVGKENAYLDAVSRQVVHDLVALVLARGFTVDDIIREEFPEVLQHWSERENWPGAVAESAGEPEEMTLDDEKRINLKRREEAHDRMRNQLSGSKGTAGGGVWVSGTVSAFPKL